MPFPTERRWQAGKKPVQTFASKELTSKDGKKFQKLYKCIKPVKHYYIYFHDIVIGGPCYLKISSYMPFPCEFYFNGHNFIKYKLDQKNISYRMKDNSFTNVSDPKALQEVAQEIQGNTVQQRINYCLSAIASADKGSTNRATFYFTLPLPLKL